MAATDCVTANITLGLPKFPYKNTSGSAITAGQTLKFDSANPLSGTQGKPGMKPTLLVADFIDGVAAENVPIGGEGGMYGVDGQALWCIALGAIAADATVGACATAGQVTTYTAANPSFGKALTAAASAADPILIYVEKSKNA